MNQKINLKETLLKTKVMTQKVYETKNQYKTNKYTETNNYWMNQ